MKKIAITAAALFAASSLLAQAQSAPGAAPAKPPVAPAAKAAAPAAKPAPVPLTAEQKLAKLTPAERSQFESHAKTLGVDSKMLAATDYATATKNIDARKDAMAKQWGSIGAGMGQAVGASASAQASNQSAQAKIDQARASQAAANMQQAQQSQVAQQQMLQRIHQEMVDMLAKMNDTQSQAIIRAKGIN